MKTHILIIILGALLFTIIPVVLVIVNICVLKEIMLWIHIVLMFYVFLVIISITVCVDSVNTLFMNNPLLYPLYSNKGSLKVTSVFLFLFQFADVLTLSPLSLLQKALSTYFLVSSFLSTSRSLCAGTTMKL